MPVHPHYYIKYKRTQKDRQARQQAYIVALKLASGCLECGYNLHAEVLEFDHVRGVKHFGIAERIGKVSFARLKAEIAKCEIVCANCHRIRTAIRR